MLGRFLVAMTAVLAVAAPVDAAPLLTAPEVSPACAAVLKTVERAHLYLPGNFAFRCPSAEFPQWWGASSYNGVTGHVALNLDKIIADGGSPAYVMAHETCHAWEQANTGRTTEEAADGCAAAHGFVFVGKPLEPPT